MSSSSEALGRITGLMTAARFLVSLSPPSWLYSGDDPSLHPLGLDKNFLYSPSGSSCGRESSESEVERFLGAFGLSLPLLKMSPSCATLLCFSNFLDPGQNGGGVGRWLEGVPWLPGQQPLKSSGSSVCGKVCSHAWLPLLHLTMTLARMGFAEEEEEEVAQPPLHRASPTCSPRPGCCFLSR